MKREICAILESTQKDGMDVTEWLVWFLDRLARAIDKSNELTAGVLVKEAFWRQLQKLTPSMPCVSDGYNGSKKPCGFNEV